MTKKKMIPCDCPKGGMYENMSGVEIVCPKCHGNEWIEEQEKLSNCCSAKIIEETDICSECKEHCEPMQKEEKVEWKEGLAKLELAVSDGEDVIEIVNFEDALSIVNQLRIEQFISNLLSQKDREWREKIKPIEEIMCSDDCGYREILELLTPPK